MKKFLLVSLLVALLAIPAFAAEFSKDKLVVGTEFSYAKKDIENLNLVNLGIGSWLSGSLTQKTSDVKLWEALVTVGYKLSDNLTPYGIVGAGYLNFDQDLVGDIQIGHHSASASLLGTEFRDSMALVLGAGAKGDLLKFDNGLILGYDTRWTTFSANSKENKMVVIEDFVIDNKQKVSYGEFNFDLLASKEFLLNDKTKDADGQWRNSKGEFVKAPEGMEKYTPRAITPIVGARYTHVDMLYKNNMTLDCVSVGIESEVQGGMVSGLVGAKIDINKSLSASVSGILGQEMGVQLKVAYNF